MKLKQLSVGSALKLGWLAISCVWLPFGLIFGVLALLGISPVSINQTPTYGIGGLIGGLIIGLVFSALGAAIFALGALASRLVPIMCNAKIPLLDEEED
jgi:uncharacterized membrane protein YkvI